MAQVLTAARVTSTRRGLRGLQEVSGRQAAAEDHRRLHARARFFLGWAQVWAQNIRPEAARQRVATDTHPLGRFRVNGPLSNMPQFAAAFQCRLGDTMVRPPDERCQIW